MCAVSSAHLDRWNVTLHCWVHLRFMELLKGFACGKQMRALWSSHSLYLTQSLQAILILGDRSSPPPTKTCHSTTHRDAWSSKLVTQLSFLSIKHQLPSALPSVNLLNNPCHLWLSRGTSSHATHRVTFQSTSQHLPEVKVSHWSCISFLWLQPRSQTFQTNARTDLGSAECRVIWARASFLPIACVIGFNCVWQLFNATKWEEPFAVVQASVLFSFISAIFSVHLSAVDGLTHPNAFKAPSDFNLVPFFSH